MCFYGYTVFVYVQTLVVIFMPFCTERSCKENNVVFVMKNETLEAVVTANRYHALLGPYGVSTAVNYFVFLMTDVYELNAQIKAPKENLAKELRDHPSKMQNVLIDDKDDAEIAEIKRAVSRALTRLRALTIKEFDTVARVVPGDQRLRRGHARDEHLLGVLRRHHREAVR